MIEKKLVNLSKKIKCFRLLNSEIGNDLLNEMHKNKE